jgi:hypothetical protein
VRMHFLGFVGKNLVFSTNAKTVYRRLSSRICTRRKSLAIGFGEIVGHKYSLFVLFGSTFTKIGLHPTMASEAGGRGVVNSTT